MKTTDELIKALMSWAETQNCIQTQGSGEMGLLVFSLAPVKTWWSKLISYQIFAWKSTAIVWYYSPPDISLLYPNKALENFLENEFNFSEDNRELLIKKKY